MRRELCRESKHVPTTMTGKRVAARAAAISREDLTSAWTSKADETLVALVAGMGRGTGVDDRALL